METCSLSSFQVRTVLGSKNELISRIISIHSQIKVQTHSQKSLKGYSPSNLKLSSKRKKRKSKLISSYEIGLIFDYSLSLEISIQKIILCRPAHGQRILISWRFPSQEGPTFTKHNNFPIQQRPHP